MPDTAAVSLRTPGRLLIAATSAASYDGDTDSAVRPGLTEKGVAAAPESGDAWCLAFGLLFQSILVMLIDRDATRALKAVEEGVAAAREAEDPVVERHRQYGAHQPR
jgi:hypothetical protein